MTSGSTGGADWWPTASREALVLRAKLLQRIRGFFEQRGVLEVETPLLGAATATDVHIASLSCRAFQGNRELFLQTSPEFAMKRLLAAGSGPIFQICKAFRDEEVGALHNPEFTMLEWYRPGFDHHALMDEVETLLGVLIETGPATRVTYRRAFVDHAGIDPHAASVNELAAAAERLGLSVSSELRTSAWERETWLALLLTHTVEPALNQGPPVFLYDFPASQAALARIRPGDPPVAERFELYVGGVELANGYHELTSAQEQRERFDADLAQRRELGLPELPVDTRLLSALEAGVPSCAGVALGLDRLLLISASSRQLSEILAFPLDRA
jgi:lysyl-tRNA synthetase class 2